MTTGVYRRCKFCSSQRTFQLPLTIQPTAFVLVKSYSFLIQEPIVYDSPISSNTDSAQRSYRLDQFIGTQIQDNTEVLLLIKNVRNILE